MSAQDHLPAVRLVEAAVATQMATRTQEQVAAAVGLVSHANVSRRLSRVAAGKLDGWLEAWTFREGLLLALDDRRTADALIAVLARSAPVPRPSQVESDLMLVAKEAAAEVAEILGDLGHEITDSEAVTLDEHLARLETDIRQARCDLMAKAASRRPR